MLQQAGIVELIPENGYNYDETNSGWFFFEFLSILIINNFVWVIFCQRNLLLVKSNDIYTKPSFCINGTFTNMVYLIENHDACLKFVF